MVQKLSQISSTRDWWETDIILLIKCNGKNWTYISKVCLTCAILHMLKQLIVVKFYWKTTIIH